MGNVQWECPNCGGEDLDYGNIVDDTSFEQAIYYPVECFDCGWSGKECYNLVFTGYEEDTK